MAGLIHIYCGDGKGKTTAAIGLAVRAAGAGKRVYFTQLLKGGECSELAALRRIPNIEVHRLDRNYGFTFSMTNDDKHGITECHNHLLYEAEQQLFGGKIDMLIIDEFNAAYKYGLVDRELADRIFFDKPSEAELVITGRDPLEKFISAADYVSEIAAVKHPYNDGISARKGIEY